VRAVTCPHGFAPTSCLACTVGEEKAREVRLSALVGRLTGSLCTCPCCCAVWEILGVDDPPRFFDDAAFARAKATAAQHVLALVQSCKA
jgi:hypothetical protein